ncbi:MAG: peptide maturase, grasp-with-spasm system, partial [Mucilaginibacter sp.]|nr:peptide maturase, grasp-with-spasm system [Mucilaginibacter sp.]
MILLASRKDDGTTCYVIEWLNALGKKYVRLNTDDDLTKFLYYDSEKNALVFIQNQMEINLFEAKSIWIRRNGFSLENIVLNKASINKDVYFDKEGFHKSHINAEMKVLIEFFHQSIKNNCHKFIGSFKNGELNKMNVLQMAERYGLKIPESFIVTTKKKLLELFEKHDNLLTKALGSGVYRFVGDKSYYSYTEKLTLKNIQSLPDMFFPSLIQVEVKKKYELRVFFLKGEFYAMAIFSQRNKNTSLDFRKPNFKIPNRKVPYSLPESIKLILKDLMAELELNTGSIDLIVDTNGDYVFLEVNPVGQ